MDSLDSSLVRFPTKHTPLPSIPQLSPARHSDPAADLFIRNGNLSEQEETVLLGEFARLVGVLNERRIEAMRTELTQYDPYENGFAETSTCQRVCLHYFKHATTEHRIWQLLFKLFARNPGLAREVNYEAMTDYFANILAALRSDVDLSSLVAAGQSKGSLAAAKAMSKSQSSLFERGDAKLIVDTELCLRLRLLLFLSSGQEIKAPVPGRWSGKRWGTWTNWRRPSMSPIEVITGRLARYDRQWHELRCLQTIIIFQEQIVNILKSFSLYNALKPVLPRIMDRCDKQGRIE